MSLHALGGGGGGGGGMLMYGVHYSTVIAVTGNCLRISLMQFSGNFPHFQNQTHSFIKAGYRALDRSAKQLGLHEIFLMSKISFMINNM